MRVAWCPGVGVRRVSCPRGGAVAAGVGSLLLTVYLLHAAPSPFLHRHGGVVPRQPARGRPPLAGSCVTPRRVDPPGERVALASAPGSGNTWLRYLLQQATGLQTGSLYDDVSLRNGGFPGEGVKNGSVLVIKTHDGRPEVRRQFRRAVLLVRSPGDAILAEFNRQRAGHVGHASVRQFQQEWPQFALTSLHYWTAFHADWLTFTGPLHVLRFSALRDRPGTVLPPLLTFLGVNASPVLLTCALFHPRGHFRRPPDPRMRGELGSRVLGPGLRRLLDQAEAEVNALIHARLAGGDTYTT